MNQTQVQSTSSTINQNLTSNESSETLLVKKTSVLLPVSFFVACLLLAVSLYHYFQEEKQTVVEEKQIINQGDKQISMNVENKKQLDAVYTSFVQAVNSGDVDAAGKIMITPLGDGKSLAGRPKEQALTVMGFESFKELFPDLSKTHFVKIFDRNNSLYYMKARTSEGVVEILVNKFTKINGDWTISLTYLNITELKNVAEISETYMNEVLEKAIVGIQ
jgi:hypothetical protein